MKTTKFIFLFIFCFNFTVTEIFAQYSIMDSFSDYSTYLLKAVGISCKKPKDFIWEKIETVAETQSIWEKRSLVSSYDGKMQSKDGNFLILYPNFAAATLNIGEGSPLDCGCCFIRRQMIYDMGKVSEQMLLSDFPDVREDVIRIVGKDTPFNADTVFIVQIPLKEPYLKKYIYCLGIYACKSGRIPISFKCYFTDNGKAEETKYLLKFYKTIKYRKKSSYDHEKDLIILHELYLKFKK